MPAETLNCPMCGAPCSTDANLCQHCGARLATVACPSCFGMMFVGEKFCSHCGAKAQRTEMAGEKPEMCPRCKVEMPAVIIGKSHLHECPHCEGIWVDADTLHQICENSEEQSAVLGMASPVPEQDSVEIEKNIRYLPCPICGDLMNRVNFANCSHVVVDVCRQHGTWFDRDELRRIVEFIRGGGLMKARAQEVEALESKKAAIETHGGAADLDSWAPASRDLDFWTLGIDVAATVLRQLLK